MHLRHLSVGRLDHPVRGADRDSERGVGIEQLGLLLLSENGQTGDDDDANDDEHEVNPERGGERVFDLFLIHFHQLLLSRRFLKHKSRRAGSVRQVPCFGSV